MKVLEELELKEEAIKSSNIRVAPGVTFVLFDSRACFKPAAQL
jgi:hypothetical protein